MKSFLKSKTIYFNLAALGYLIGAHYLKFQTMEPEHLAAIVSAFNIFLRSVTYKGVTVP